MGRSGLKCPMKSKSQDTEQQSVNAKTLKILSQGTQKEMQSLTISPLAITPKFLKERKETALSKKIYDMAKKNYPTLWNREMIDHLHDIGRLTDAEYADVIGDDGGDE